MQTAPSFSDLQLCEALQSALEDAGYDQPTPIQAQAIPHLLDGRDLLASAQTGTGKTAAFAIPLLQQLATQPKKAIAKSPRVLILSPTRELAAQIGASMKSYGRHVRFRQTIVFGGVGQSNQVRALQKGVHVLIATPGRLLDLMDQGFIRLDLLDAFVLDEADRMLDMGFQPDLKRIIAELPEERQSLFFSATLQPEICELAYELLKDPVRVEVAPTTRESSQIDQKVLYVRQGNKGKLLKTLLDNEFGQTLIFTKTKRGADLVAKHLGFAGEKADALHGNKSQNQRTRILHRFRSGKSRILVATDVAARGIDVDGITHVINYDIPLDPESYVHRIGRTGRAGASGIALSFCDPEERFYLRAIEKLIGNSIPIEKEHPFHEEPAAQEPRSRGRGAKGRRPQGRGYSRKDGPSGPKADVGKPTGGKRKKRRFAGKR